MKKTEKEKIMEHVVMNVMSEIDPKLIDALCNKDSRHASLYSDLKKAETNKQFFKAKIIQNQLDHRRTEITVSETERRLRAYLANGLIHNFLPTEQRRKFDRATTMIFLLLNAADSAAVDLFGMYEECGFGPDELNSQKEIKEIRKKLNALTHENELQCDSLSDILNDEADKIYNSLRSRYDVIMRKCERAAKRQEKEDEDKKMQDNNARG